MFAKVKNYFFILSLLFLFTKECFSQLSIEQLLYPKFDTKDSFINYRKVIISEAQKIDKSKSKDLGEIVEFLELLYDYYSSFANFKLFSEDMEVLEENIIIKWPVILNKNNKQFRNLAKGLVKAKREVDNIIKNELKLEPYKGIIPLWIYLNPSEQKYYSAGKTIGSCLVMLFIKEVKTSDFSNTIKISHFETKKIIDTFKHEYIHYYENFILGYEGEKYIPKDFSEGIATALINSHLLKGYSDIELYRDGSYSMQTKVVEAPDEYKKYHLQMKYLRVKYGKETFNNFLREVLQGKNIDYLTVKYFNKPKWEELFPSDLDLKFVQAGIKEKSFKSFFALFLSFIFIVISFYILYPLLIYKSAKKKKKEDNLFKLLDRIELIKARMNKKLYLNWKILLIIGFFLLLIIYFQYNRDFCNTLNIDGADRLAIFSDILKYTTFSFAFLIFTAQTFFKLNFIRKLKPEIIAKKYSEKEVFIYLKLSMEKIENYKNKDLLFKYLITKDTIKKFKEEEEKHKNIYIKYFIDNMKDKILKNKYEESLNFFENEKDNINHLRCKDKLYNELNNIINNLLKDAKEMFLNNKIEESIELGDFIIQLCLKSNNIEYFSEEVKNIYYRHFKDLSLKLCNIEFSEEEFKTAFKMIYLSGILDILKPNLNFSDTNILFEKLKYFLTLEEIFACKSAHSFVSIINENIENIKKRLPFEIRIIFE